MSSSTVAFQVVLQGIYSMIWIAILLDAGSPSFDLRNYTNLTWTQGVIAMVFVATMSYAVGIMMHTGSRNIFRRTKDLWALKVLSSPAVQDRLDHLQVDDYLASMGGPTMQQAMNAEGQDRIRKAGAVMHALDYAVMTRDPDVHKNIQVYRSQYRLARGFIVPSIALALVVPLWEPIGSPIVGLQLFLLGILFAAFSFVAFKERSFRYEAARLRAFVTLEGERKVQQQQKLQLASKAA